ncbi:MAG TPA: pyridoxamine 5'-phosphate oxidase family protein [Sphingomicrobium sp.]|nr:pyridoxamine 5'-phosphate oxidase family protein [Sphingomicrobium sp.]
MSGRSLKDISEKMRDIDFAMLATKTQGGAIAARPMSNNRQVEYDGDNYFFTLQNTGTVSDITSDPNVGLCFQGKSGALGLKPFFITIEGIAELIRDVDQFAEHWTSDLDEWFKEGVDTPGLVLIKVHAKRIHYWDGYDQGEVELDGADPVETSG